MHPYTDSGHQVYFETIQRSFGKFIGAGKRKDHCVCTPLAGKTWQRAGFAGPNRHVNWRWQKLPTDHPLAKRFANRSPSSWQVDQAGATLNFEFTGTHVGFYDILGPDCGQIEVSIDGAKKTMSPSLRWLLHLSPAEHGHDRLRSERRSAHREGTDIGESARQSQDPPRPSTTRSEKNPSKYDGTKWYVGGILVIGELEDASNAPTEAKPSGG